MLIRSRSLLAGKFSDLTVKHGEQKWKAHKIVVCSQSTILESMITDEVSTSRLVYQFSLAFDT